MTYAFVQDVPIDEAMYGRIRANLGAEPPDGLISHIVLRGTGGLRYVEVWASQDDWERFCRERLHPVVHPMLAAIFGDTLPPEPPRSSDAVLDVWVGGASGITESPA